MRRGDRVEHRVPLPDGDGRRSDLERIDLDRPGPPCPAVHDGLGDGAARRQPDHVDHHTRILSYGVECSCSSRGVAAEEAAEDVVEHLRILEVADVTAVGDDGEAGAPDSAIELVGNSPEEGNTHSVDLDDLHGWRLALVRIGVMPPV